MKPNSTFMQVLHQYFYVPTVRVFVEKHKTYDSRVLFLQISPSVLLAPSSLLFSGKPLGLLPTYSSGFTKILFANPGMNISQSNKKFWKIKINSPRFPKFKNYFHIRKIFKVFKLKCWYFLTSSKFKSAQQQKKLIKWVAKHYRRIYRLGRLKKYQKNYVILSREGFRAGVTRFDKLSARVNLDCFWPQNRLLTWGHRSII